MLAGNEFVAEQPRKIGVASWIRRRGLPFRVTCSGSGLFSGHSLRGSCKTRFCREVSTPATSPAFDCRRTATLENKLRSGLDLLLCDSFPCFCKLWKAHALLEFPSQKCAPVSLFWIPQKRHFANCLTADAAVGRLSLLSGRTFRRRYSFCRLNCRTAAGRSRQAPGTIARDSITQYQCP
jgi:hypothetical protein